jgi:hypothetical protein
MADGLVERCRCLPEKTGPRWLVALVFAPDKYLPDAHWYHRHRGGFWGHKPGTSIASNLDSRGRLIMNPEICYRGSYSEFCGYFYVDRSVVID